MPDFFVLARVVGSDGAFPKVIKLVALDQGVSGWMKTTDSILVVETKTDTTVRSLSD